MSLAPFALPEPGPFCLASDSLSLKSGHDTTLQGAQLAAKTVKAEVGGDFRIATLQDSSRYESKQSNSGFSLSLCIPPTISGSGDPATDEQSQQIADELTSRDPATANQSLSNTLTLQQAQVLEQEIQRNKENQEAAKLVGAVLSNVVGDIAANMQKPWADASMRDLLDKKQANGESLNAAELNLLDRLNRDGMTSEIAAKTLADPDAFAQYKSWAEGSTTKMALHGLVGLIEAKVGGSSAPAGALGGISQEALAPVMAQYLEEQGIKSGTAEYSSLVQLGATLTGAAVGALASGDVQGASAGANAAFVGVTNNFLKHAEVGEMINKLKACKARQCSEKEQEDILGYYRKLSAGRSDYDLLNPEIAADVLAGEQLMSAYMKTSGSFRINSTIAKLFEIDRQQASVAMNTPVVQAAPSGADRLKALKEQTYGAQQAQNLTDSLIIASPVLLPASLVKIGTLAFATYELGYGGAAIYDEEYLTGIGHIGLGALTAYGVNSLGKPVAGVVNDAGLGANSVTPYGTTLSDEVAALRQMSAANNSVEGSIANARISLKAYIVDGDVGGLVANLDVSTGGRPTGFWSGNLEAAMNQANFDGVALLETTRGGSIANGWGFLNRKFSWESGGEEFWGGLSSKYASGATGDIFIWQAPDRAVSSSGVLNWKGGYVWQNYEQPVVNQLQTMGTVGKINYRLVEPTIANSPLRWH